MSFDSVFPKGEPNDADSWFSHVAIAVPGENTDNEWLEPVTDEYYNTLTEKRSIA